MSQPVIAVGLKGVLIDARAWEEAHELWFRMYAKQLDDESILTWIGRDNYFMGVEEVMRRVLPDASDEERTVRARKEYFESVIAWVEQHNGVRDSIVQALETASKHARIVVLTSSKEDAATHLLTHIPECIVSATYASLPEEKDDKKAVFTRMLEHEEKPLVYIGSGRQETKDICTHAGITAIDASAMHGKELLSALNQILGFE